LSVSDFASCFHSPLKVRREEVGERQPKGLEVLTKAGGLLIAVVGEG
jgi:hypothetical protein